MVIDWNIVIFTYHFLHNGFFHILFERLELNFFDAFLLTQIISFRVPLATVFFVLNELSIRHIFLEIAQFTVSVVRGHLPLVSFSHSPLELTFFDLHQPIAFVMWKWWIIFFLLINIEAPVVCESTKTIKSLFYLVEQYKLVAIWIEHLSFPIPNFQGADIM